MKKSILLGLAMGIATLSEAQLSGPKETYFSPALKSSLETHKTIAILPVEVRFVYKTQQMNFNTKAERAAEINSGIILQSNLYSYLLPKTNKMSVSIQDIETTNILLRRAEEGKEQLELTKVEMAKLLGVDAVISSLYETERPIPEMLNHRNRPNTAPTTLTIYEDPNIHWGALTLSLTEATNGTLLWRSYKKTFNANTYVLSDELIPKLLKDLPYTK